MQAEIKSMCVNVESLHKEIEERMGLHFKLIDFFLALIESDAEMVDRYGYTSMVEPLKLFPSLFRMRELKQCLMAFLK